jgi:hypothetical protein
MIRRVVAVIVLLGLATPAAARDSLGIFEGWGAFRDDRPLRCFAISEPAARSAGGRWRPFASVAHWPGQRVRGQLHIRMSRTRAADAVVTLTVGEQRFRLAAGGADAWAPDPRADGAIVAAMRSATSMAVTSRGANGRAFTDAYRLRGAATAIDAAALGCARR